MANNLFPYLDKQQESPQPSSGLGKIPMFNVSQNPTESNRIGRAQSFVSNIGRGAANVVASIPQAIPEAASALGFTKNPEESSLYKAGEDLKTAANKALPVNPEYQEEFSQKLGQGLGSMAAFLAGGELGAIAKVPRLLSTAAAGAAAGGMEGVQDIKNTAAKQGKQVDPEQRSASFLLNAATGLSEAAPIGLMFNRLDKLTNGSVKKAILASGIRGAGEEGLQEAFQNISQNLIANKLVGYDPERNTFTGTADNAAVGGTIGFLMNTLASSIGHRRAGKFEQAAAQADLKNTFKGLNTPQEIQQKALEDRMVDHNDKPVDPVTGSALQTGELSKAQQILKSLHTASVNHPEEANAYKAKAKELIDSLNQKYVNDIVTEKDGVKSSKPNNSNPVAKLEAKNLSEYFTEAFNGKKAAKAEGINAPDLSSAKQEDMFPVDNNSPNLENDYKILPERGETYDMFNTPSEFIDQTKVPPLPQVDEVQPEEIEIKKPDNRLIHDVTTKVRNTQDQIGAIKEAEARQKLQWDTDRKNLPLPDVTEGDSIDLQDKLPVENIDLKGVNPVRESILKSQDQSLDQTITGVNPVREQILAKQDRELQKQFEIQPNDILTKSGKPFKDARAAKRYISNNGLNAEVATVSGGFTVRPIETQSNEPPITDAVPADTTAAIAPSEESNISQPEVTQPELDQDAETVQSDTGQTEEVTAAEGSKETSKQQTPEEPSDQKEQVVEPVAQSESVQSEPQQEVPKDLQQQVEEAAARLQMLQSQYEAAENDLDYDKADRIMSRLQAAQEAYSKLNNKLQGYTESVKDNSDIEYRDKLNSSFSEWAKDVRKDYVESFEKSIESLKSKLNPNLNLDIKYVNTYSDLSEEERVLFSRVHPGLFQGLFLNNKKTGKSTIYLIGDRHRDLRSLQGTLMHELIGHYGMRQIFGKQWNDFLDQIISSDKSRANYIASLSKDWSGYLKEFPADKTSATYVIDGQEVKISKEAMRALADEYVAEMAREFADNDTVNKHWPQQGSGKSVGLFQRILNLVKRAISGLGFKEYSKSVTDQDIMNLLGQSYSRVFDNTAVESTSTNDEIRLAAERASEQDAQPSEIIGTTSLMQKGYGQLNEAGHRKYARQLFEAMSSKAPAFLQPLGKLAGEKYYNLVNSKAMGGIYKGEQMAVKLAKALKPLSKAQRQDVMEYFTTAGASADNMMVPVPTRKLLEEAKQWIADYGRNLVDQGLLQEEVYQENLGTYLPRMYYKYMNEYIGSGKKPSLLNYLKERSKDLEPEAQAALGKIEDPEFILPMTVGIMSRDIALLNMFDNIQKVSQNQSLAWVLNEENYVKYRGKNTTLDHVERELAHYEELLKDGIGGRVHGYTAESYAQVQARRDEAAEAVRVGTENMKAHISKLAVESGENLSPDDYLSVHYERMPRKYRFGKLSNMYVRKEIKQDLADLLNLYSMDTSNPFINFIKPGGTLDSWNQMWKAVHTTMNPPTVMRNAVGNLIMLDMSTSTPMPKLLKMLYEEVEQNMKGQPSRFLKLAKDMGAFGTTFSGQELGLLRSKYIDIMNRAKAKDTEHPITSITFALQHKWHAFIEFTSEVYGDTEGIFKTLKMRDHIETWEKQNNQKFDKLDPVQQRAIASEAINEANKWLFDYSKVPAFVRTLRRYPLGAPFATFTFKSFPRIVEGMMTRPEKFMKYVALPSLMIAAFYAANPDLDDEDRKQIVRDLPMYTKDKSSVMMLPIKRNDGKWYYLDMSYMYPFAPFMDEMIYAYNHFEGANAAEGAASVGGEALHSLHTFGFLGGPVPSMVAALTTNKDPFLQRDIVNQGDPASKQLADVFRYMTTLALPGFLASHGLLGRTLDNLGIDTGGFLNEGRQFDKTGRDAETGLQTAMSGMGLTVKSVYPTQSRLDNLQFFDKQIKDTTAARNKALEGMKGNSQERIRIFREYNEKLQRLRDERGEYLKGK
jgi:hypothetical protein